MNTATGALSALRRLIIMIAIAIVFLFGLAMTVFLSLRSPEVKVPDVVGKDRLEAEQVLGAAGLNFRVRATRPSSQMQADVVLFQLPKGGEVVKAGQTVAMDLSRPVKEGEASEAVIPEKSPEEKPSSQNTNEATSANANKPKPKSTNKNENDNGNANTANRNSNSNRAAANNSANSGNANRATNLNLNRPVVDGNANSNRGGNQNGTIPPAAPKPSPAAKPTQENP